MHQDQEQRRVGSINECAQATDSSTIGCATIGMRDENVPTIRTTVEVAARHGFGVALDACFHGQRITRAGWNGAGQYVTAQYPDKLSKMSQPYLVLRNAQGDLIPWVPSQGDLFARDWAVLPVQPIHG